MSENRRIYRKTERTPEELAELKAERERFSRSGRGLGSDRIGRVRRALPARRPDGPPVRPRRAQARAEGQGLSLAEVSGRSGLDKAMLSRLENGKVLNPTVATLWRYAEAVGMSLKLSAEKVPSRGR